MQKKNGLLYSPEDIKQREGRLRRKDGMVELRGERKWKERGIKAKWGGNQKNRKKSLPHHGGHLKKNYTNTSKHKAIILR